MLWIVGWLAACLLLSAIWTAAVLWRRLADAEELLARERVHGAELAQKAAEAMTARHTLEMRVRALLPAPLASAVLSPRALHIATLHSPEDLRRVLESVATVIPIRRDTTKH